MLPLSLQKVRTGRTFFRVGIDEITDLGKRKTFLLLLKLVAVWFHTISLTPELYIVELYIVQHEDVQTVVPSHKGSNTAATSDWSVEHWWMQAIWTKFPDFYSPINFPHILIFAWRCGFEQAPKPQGPQKCCQANNPFSRFLLCAMAGGWVRPVMVASGATECLHWACPRHLWSTPPHARYRRPYRLCHPTRSEDWKGRQVLWMAMFRLCKVQELRAVRAPMVDLVLHPKQLPLHSLHLEYRQYREAVQHWVCLHCRNAPRRRRLGLCWNHRWLIWWATVPWIDGLPDFF